MISFAILLVSFMTLGKTGYHMYVAASENASFNSSIRKTLHFVSYDTDKPLPDDVFLQSPIPVYSMDDYAISQIRSFLNIHKSVRGIIMASREKMMPRQHSQA